MSFLEKFMRVFTRDSKVLARPEEDELERDYRDALYAHTQSRTAKLSPEGLILPAQLPPTGLRMNVKGEPPQIGDYHTMDDASVLIYTETGWTEVAPPSYTLEDCMEEARRETIARSLKSRTRRLTPEEAAAKIAVFDPEVDFTLDSIEGTTVNGHFSIGTNKMQNPFADDLLHDSEFMNELKSI